MNRLLLAGAFACPLSSHGWAAADSDGTRPDPKLTPGAVRTTDAQTMIRTDWVAAYKRLISKDPS